MINVQISSRSIFVSTPSILSALGSVCYLQSALITDKQWRMGDILSKTCGERCINHVTLENRTMFKWGSLVSGSTSVIDMRPVSV